MSRCDTELLPLSCSAGSELHRHWVNGRVTSHTEVLHSDRGVGESVALYEGVIFYYCNINPLIANTGVPLLQHR